MASAAQALPRGRRAGSLNDIYRLHQPELCRYLNKTFGAGPPDPEDVVQAAFTKFAALEKPEKIENPRAFLFRTAHNIALNELRKTATHNGYAKEIENTTGGRILDEVDAERVLIAKEKAEVLEAAIKRLPKKNRRLLLLHRIHGLSYAKISRQTGISQTQVKRLIAESLAECSEALRGQDPDHSVKRRCE